MEYRFRVPFAFVVLSTICLVGCGTPKPDTIAASGVVTINGEPVPNAEVRFIPMHEGLDGTFIAIGISDAEGKFVLRFPGKTESSVCIGENRILIFEGPVPDSARGQSEKAQLEAIKFTKALENRPIPRKYSNLSESQLSINVSADKSEYPIDLKRE